MKNLIRHLLKRSPLKHLWYYRYDYNFSPSQLAFLINEVSQASRHPGNFVEIGCAYGNTTVFLNKHMDHAGIERPYICIDTFDGFTEADIAHEINMRGKSPDMFAFAFRENSKGRFDATMQFNRINRVTSYQADINKFDISELGQIAFCLFDVDLYRPTAAALPMLYDQLSDGGMIIVDDCIPNNRFDGAWQAYNEFCHKNSLPIEIVEQKLGLLRKPHSVAGVR